MISSVPGIDRYPDLVKRFETQYARVATKDNCGGCKLRDVIDTFKVLVQKRQRRDNDFRRR